MGIFRYKSALLVTFVSAIVGGFIFEASATASICKTPGARYAIVPINYEMPMKVDERDRFDNGVRFRDVHRGNWFKLCYEYNENGSDRNSPLHVFFSGGPGQKTIGVSFVHSRLPGFANLVMDVRGTYENHGLSESEVREQLKSKAIDDLDNSKVFPANTIRTDWVVADMFMILSDLCLLGERGLVVTGSSYGTIPATIFAHVLSSYQTNSYLSGELPRVFSPNVKYSRDLGNAISNVSKQFELRATILTGVISEKLISNDIANLRTETWLEFLNHQKENFRKYIKSLGVSNDVGNEIFEEIRNIDFTLESNREAPRVWGARYTYVPNTWYNGIIPLLREGPPAWPTLAERLVGTMANSMQLKGKVTLQVLFPPSTKPTMPTAKRAVRALQFDSGLRFISFFSGWVDPLLKFYDSENFQIKSGVVQYITGHFDPATPVQHSYRHFELQQNPNKHFLYYENLGHNPLSYMEHVGLNKCMNSIYKFAAQGMLSDSTEDCEIKESNPNPKSNDEQIAEIKKPGKQSLSGFVPPK
jgi:hypothetical protein